jgi:mRNA interferase RelE/StbE
MNSQPRFEVRFDPGAFREYQKLDNSVLLLVDKSLKDLEDRADEIGKPLSNTCHAKLAGCREIKLRDAGLRIVYRITGQKVDILEVVYVLAIEKRADGYVFATQIKDITSLKR